MPSLYIVTKESGQKNHYSMCLNGTKIRRKASQKRATKKRGGGEKNAPSQERTRAVGNCTPERAKGQRKNPPPQKKQEQWVTVPPPPQHYLVKSLMVTKQNSSAAASSKPWHMDSYQISQCIQVRHCVQDSRGSSRQLHSELESSLVQKRPLAINSIASPYAGSLKSVQ